MKHLTPIFIFIIYYAVFSVTPVQAGDPDDTIGPVNPNLYVCTDDQHRVIPLDSDAFGGRSDADADISFFDETIEVDLDKLKDECEEFEKDENINTRVELLQQTKIEGVVYEFYPDPNAPATGPKAWIGVPSRDVLVVATGIAFEIFWGSEKDGSYFFNYLGAGPITLNLRLPLDAHPINPNVTVQSTSFFETWRVPLGFYRGDTPPGENDTFTIPTGETLPPANTIFDDLSLSGGMPNVGGILPPDSPIPVIIVAGLVLIILPTAGLLKLRTH